MTQDWAKLRQRVKDTDTKVLQDVIRGLEGHKLYAPERFLEAGLDAEIVEAFTEVHESGLDLKEQLFVDGVPVNQLREVYGLQLLEFIASVFDVSSWKMGRCSRAFDLAEQLMEKFSHQ